MAEKKVKMRKDGLPKAPLSIFEKIVIALSVVLIIATVACGVLRAGLNSIPTLESLKDLSGEGLEIDEKMLDRLDLIVPDEVELESGDGIKFTIGLEINKKFDASQTKSVFDYLDVFNVYDSKGTLVGNEEKIEKFGITGMQLKVMALMKLADKLVTVKKIVNNVFIVLILLDIVAAIFIAYFIWRRADDRREIREAMMRENETKKVTGLTEEEAQNAKSAKKKKKKKK